MSAIHALFGFIKPRHSLAMGLLTVGLASFAWAQPETRPSPAIQYVETLLASLDHMEENLPAITRAAEQAAERLLEGGILKMATVKPANNASSFAKEGTRRSGGLIMTEMAPRGTATSATDVLLVGALGAGTDLQQQQMQAAQEEETLVVLFGSDASPLREDADLLISTGLEAGTVPAITVDGRIEAICPVAPAANIAALWVFTGELVAACTRQGKMPVLYQSGGTTEGQAWNQTYQSVLFHEDIVVDPVPGGQLGRAYLTEIRRCLQGLITQQASFQAGGRMIAGVLEEGGRAWVAVYGQSMPDQFGLPGDPGLFDPSLNQNTWSGWVNAWRIDENSTAPIGIFAPEDGLVYVGWDVRPTWAQWQPLRDLGLPSVWITGGREVDALSPEPLPWEIHIDPYWTAGDACVEVPGYPIKILPPSGVVQTAALWTLTGEVAQALHQGSSTAVEAGQEEVAPNAFFLASSYPNPFNSSTVIRFALPVAGEVELSLFNLAGQRVATLVRGMQEAGTYAVRWDGTGAAGQALASGVYLYRLQTGGPQVQTRKLLLLR